MLYSDTGNRVALLGRGSHARRLDRGQRAGKSSRTSTCDTHRQRVGGRVDLWQAGRTVSLFQLFMIRVAKALTDRRARKRAPLAGALPCGAAGGAGGQRGICSLRPSSNCLVRHAQPPPRRTTARRGGFCSTGGEIRVTASSAVAGGTTHLVRHAQPPPRRTTARGTERAGQRLALSVIRVMDVLKIEAGSLH